MLQNKTIQRLGVINIMSQKSQFEPYSANDEKNDSNSKQHSLPARKAESEVSWNMKCIKSGSNGFKHMPLMRHNTMSTYNTKTYYHGDLKGAKSTFDENYSISPPNNTMSKMINAHSIDACDTVLTNQDNEKDLFDDDKINNSNQFDHISIASPKTSCNDTIHSVETMVEIAKTVTNHSAMKKTSREILENGSNIMPIQEQIVPTKTNVELDRAKAEHGAGQPKISLAISQDITKSDASLCDNENADSDSHNRNQSSLRVGLMTLNDTKAGMDGLDTERINSIIEDASKGSKFYEAKAKNQKRIDEQIENLIMQAKSLLPANIKVAENEANSILEEETNNSDKSRTIVHVDMDAFYAAVHERDNPSLKMKPMAVGSMGMLSTSNYLARKFGVRAGMPGFIGKKLCPELVIIPTNFPKYNEVAAVVRGIFADYDPNFMPMSLDEAYLDITDYLKAKGQCKENAVQCETDFAETLKTNIIPNISDNALAEIVVNEMRSKIEKATNGLTASAGIAHNTLLAKICSDYKKPNGQYILKGAQEITQFVNKLPVRKVSGIGNVSEQLLSKVLNIKTCGDLFEKRGLVLLLFKPATAHFLLRASIGLGDTMLSCKESARKSMSSETTFEDTSDPQTLFSVCDNVCTDLAMTLRNNEEGPLKGRQVTVKIKTHKFEIKTKVATLQLPSCDYEIISSVARKILKQFMDLAVDKPLNLRLIGVRISGFNDPLKKHSTSNQPNIQKYLSHKVSKFDQNLPLAQRISHKKKGNRQPGIQSVLTTKSFSKFNCPICREEIQTENENTFNSHLDMCLGSFKSRSLTTNKQPKKGQTGNDTNSKGVINENDKYGSHSYENDYRKLDETREHHNNMSIFHDICAHQSDRILNHPFPEENQGVAGSVDKELRHDEDTLAGIGANIPVSNRSVAKKANFNNADMSYWGDSPNIMIKDTTPFNGLPALQTKFEDKATKSYPVKSFESGSTDPSGNLAESCKSFECALKDADYENCNFGNVPREISFTSSNEYYTSAQNLSDESISFNERY